ncbi:MAG TPA: hypothetical protein ENG14_01660 [Thermodesulforhabdus norvegica]|uniref:Mut7-C RNAse domain-containing protein n=1 Tax=Thermodesulforhabdus norvegica TaxID=39841 RepID=A0A7C1AW01_9BACT|nr:hypothetical protein [Thermodesulforhabdus norvegica]
MSSALIYKPDSQDTVPNRFVVDAMLGKMAKWLRVLGADTLYTRLKSAEEIRRFMASGRIVITKNRKWEKIEGIVCLEANRLDEQFAELAQKIRTKFPEEFWFSRCVTCNEILIGVDKHSIKGKVPEYVWNSMDEFSMCPSCLKIFWEGSHVGRMVEKACRLSKMFKNKEEVET